AYIKLAVSLGTNADLRQQTSDRLKQKFAKKPSFLDSYSYSTQMGELFQKLFQSYLADTLSDNLSLRDINFIIFPDWTQAEETVGLELQEVIKNLVTHPDRAKMTLLIDNSNIIAEDADLILSSVAMNLLMEEELEVDEGPEIILLGELSQIQWSALIPQLQGRIKLEHENGEAIAQLKAENIPVIELNNLSENIQTFQTKML
ncbi:MAG: methyltransferase type 11, partial [Trichodesmium sp. St18_bin1]|nr:methyltransferase type 11 [Trichodesmium sp. St18_bin1]